VASALPNAAKANTQAIVTMIQCRAGSDAIQGAAISNTPPPIHAKARATERNQRLAELIDEIDKLSNKDVIERRRSEVYAAQAKSAIGRADHELALEAAEYVKTSQHE